MFFILILKGVNWFGLIDGCRMEAGRGVGTEQRLTLLHQHVEEHITPVSIIVDSHERIPGSCGDMGIVPCIARSVGQHRHVIGLHSNFNSKNEV